MHSLQPHRRHGGVMHYRDSHAAQKNAGGKGPSPSFLAAAHDKQRPGRTKNGHQERKQYRGPVVLHRNRQVECQHSGVMHRPGTDSIYRGAEDQPGKPSPTTSGVQSFGQITRGVRCQDGDHRGQRNQTVIVITDHDQLFSHHGSVLELMTLRWGHGGVVLEERAVKETKPAPVRSQGRLGKYPGEYRHSPMDGRRP